MIKDGIRKEFSKRKMNIVRSFKGSLIKGKSAQEGEIRTHGGVKVKSKEKSGFL